MTDERAVVDNAYETETQDVEGLEQEATRAPREAPAGRARPRDEGARVLRRVVHVEPAGVGRGPVELFLSHGRPGHRRHGAREGVPVRVPGRPLSVAREPGAAPLVPDAGEVRQEIGRAHV